MEAASRCLFCQKLPEITSSRKGKRGRCPLCKGELLESGGTSYRLSGESGPRHFPKWPLASLVALVGAIIFLKGWFGTHADSQQPEPSPSVELAKTPTHTKEPIAPFAKDQRTKAAALLPLNVPSKPAATDLFFMKAKAKPGLALSAILVKTSATDRESLAFAKWAVPNFSEGDLQKALLQVPEVGLDRKLADDLRIAHASTEDLLSIAQRQDMKANKSQRRELTALLNENNIK